MLHWYSEIRLYKKNLTNRVLAVALVGCAQFKYARELAKLLLLFLKFSVL